MRTPPKLTPRQIKIIQTIIRYAAETSEHDLKPSDIQKSHQTQTLAEDRQLAYLLIRDHTDITLEHLAEILNRSISTLKNNLAKAKLRMAQPTFQLRYQTLAEELTETINA